MYETSGTNHVTKPSLYLALKNTMALTQEESDELFTQIDKDQRGWITYDEFRSFVENKHEYKHMFRAGDYTPDKPKDD